MILCPFTRVGLFVPPATAKIKVFAGESILPPVVSVEPCPDPPEFVTYPRLNVECFATA